MIVGFVWMLLTLPPVWSDITTLSPGDRGTCKTVFAGESSETFAFEVKEVLYHFTGPHRHVILVKLLGKKVHFTGVAEGMSGSPCSIRGKLLGALAYAFGSFNKEPIAGITPIVDMLPVLSFASTAVKTSSAVLPPKDRWLQHQSHPLQPSMATEQHQAGLQAIGLQLWSAGIQPHLRQELFPLLQEAGLGWSSNSALGSGPAHLHPPQNSLKSKKLRAGDAISAVLVKGDVDLAASGTVTLVDGNRVYAFGHPFMSAGTVTMPMASASVLYTLATAQRASKIIRAETLIGTFTQDRSTALAGYLGSAPEMMPVHGDVKTDFGLSSFQFDVVRDRILTPRLLAVALAAGLAQRIDASQQGTLALDATLHAAQYPPLHLHIVRAAVRDETLWSSVGLEVARVVETLWYTPFGMPKDMRIHLRAEYSPEVNQHTIESLDSSAALVRPGERLTWTVKMRNHQGELKHASFAFKVPTEWAGSQVHVYAVDATIATHMQEFVSRNSVPENLESVWRKVSQRYADGRIYLLAVRLGHSLYQLGQNDAFVPGTAALTWSDRAVVATPITTLLHRWPQEGSVQGYAKSSLLVSNL